MEKVKWQMQENFIFPEFAGLPTGSNTVNVTPRYTEDRTEDAVRLKGIYHIAANVLFNEGEFKVETPGKAILIDDVDLNDRLGYFEYAVPLNIDLPANAGSPLDIITKNATCEVDGQGVCGILWDVECSYKEIVEEIVEEEKVEEVSVAMEDLVTITDTSLFSESDEVLSFISELGDDMSATIFRSNDVFVENKS